MIKIVWLFISTLCQVDRERVLLLFSSSIYVGNFSENSLPKTPLAIRVTGKRVTRVVIYKTELPVEATSGHNTGIFLISDILGAREHTGLLPSICGYIGGTRIADTLSRSIQLLVLLSVQHLQGVSYICSFHDGSGITKHSSIK